MNQKPGFTTGSISGDLDAKFGKNRVPHESHKLFIASQLIAYFAFSGLILVVTLPVLWVIKFLWLNPGFVSTHLQQFVAMLK